MSDVKNNSDEEEKQLIRAELRINFLKTLKALKGKEAEITLYQQTKPVTGTFQVTDRENLNFGFSDFTAPNGAHYDDVLLRTTDITKIEFNNIN